MGIGNPFKSIENKIKKGFNSLGDEIRGGLRKAGSEIEGGIKKAGREVEGGVKSVGREVEGGVRKVGREVEDGIVKKLPELVTETLPDVLGKALQALASEAVKPILKAAAREVREFRTDMEALAESDPELVDAINALGFSVTLKLNAEIVLSYSGFYARAQEVAGILDRYGNDGIAVRRRDIIGFIDAIGPTAVDLGVGAELSLGVDAGAKFSMDAIPLKLFTRLGDRALKRLGVPE